MKGIEAAKAFREKFGAPSKELLEKVKYDNKAIAGLKAALKSGPKTVPQMAKEAGIPEHEAMWYMNALKKYGEVTIEGADEAYKLYALKAAANGQG